MKRNSNSSFQTPRPRRAPTPPRRPGSPPRTKDEGYEQFLNEAVRASADYESRARYRREQRRKNNLIWGGAFLFLLVFLVAILAMRLRGGGNPPAENVAESSVQETARVGASTEAGTIPVIIQLASGDVAGSALENAKVVLASSDAAYKIVGKGEASEAQTNPTGEMSLPIVVPSGTVLEVCAGDACGEQSLTDEDATAEVVALKVAADLPYILCARDVGTGTVRRLAKFRAMVKVSSPTISPAVAAP